MQLQSRGSDKKNLKLEQKLVELIVKPWNGTGEGGLSMFMPGVTQGNRRALQQHWVCATGWGISATTAPFGSNRSIGPAGLSSA